MEKILYIIAGGNGSGKITLATELLPAENLDFLNADDIAKEICPENIESVKVTAGKILLQRLEALLKSNKSFAIETTLAGSLYIKTINNAKKLGYKIVIIYSFVDKPLVSINRIKIRVLNGGHYVPEEDVIRRFSRSKNNFWYKYKDIVDEWNLFYNGGAEYVLVANFSDNKIEVFHEKLYNMFTKDFIS